MILSFSSALRKDSYLFYRVIRFIVKLYGTCGEITNRFLALPGVPSFTGLFCGITTAVAARTASTLLSRRRLKQQESRPTTRYILLGRDALVSTALFLAPETILLSRGKGTCFGTWPQINVLVSYVSHLSRI